VAGSQTLSLALFAVKRRSLSLHSAMDSCLPARRTEHVRPLIHLMVILISAVLVQSIAIRAVAEGRAFIGDGFVQNSIRCVRESLDLPPGNAGRSAEWRNAGFVENLAGVQITDAGHA
jgi:hypothetical protein